jgi:ribosome maturation factor RimP
LKTANIQGTFKEDVSQIAEEIIQVTEYSLKKVRTARQDALSVKRILIQKANTVEELQEELSRRIQKRLYHDPPEL